MRRIIYILVVLSLFTLSCTHSKSDKNNSPIIQQLKLENDSLKSVLRKQTKEVRLEINMIVTDAKQAAAYYKKVLNAEILSQTDTKSGMNETMMKLGGVEIRVLDENKNLGLFAPEKVGTSSIGINLFVNDIDAFVNNAVKAGCKILSPIREFPDIPAKNAVFSDEFNHLWVVNQKY